MFLGFISFVLVADGLRMCFNTPQTEAVLAGSFPMRQESRRREQAAARLLGRALMFVLGVMGSGSIDRRKHELASYRVLHRGGRGVALRPGREAAAHRAVAAVAPDRPAGGGPGRDPAPPQRAWRAPDRSREGVPRGCPARDAGLRAGPGPFAGRGGGLLRHAAHRAGGRHRAHCSRCAGWRRRRSTSGCPKCR